MPQDGQIKVGDTYTVQAGDTLSSIAQRAYGDGSRTHWMAIYRTNQDQIGDNPDLIQPGVSLHIPPFANSPTKENYYIVQGGDTLSGIAQKAYGDGLQAYWMTIYLVNQYDIGDPNVIYPGASIYIPPIVTTLPQIEWLFYLAQPGDTLSNIAQRNYGTAMQWQEIYNSNKNVIGNDANASVSGQVLLLPGSGGGGNIHIPKNPTWGQVSIGK
jgi:nucleoid-associated protein YgaU